MTASLRRQSPARGTAHNLLVLVLACFTIVALLAYALVRLSQPASSARSGSKLLVYCAAGIRFPVEQVAARYEEEYGVSIQLQYGGSNTLLSQLEISRTGDLYLAADNSYLELARNKGLAEEIVPLARMKPVIAVPKDNPHNIQSIDDLLRPEIQVALGNPDAAAVGKKTRKLLTKTGHWEDLARQAETTGVFKPTVNEVANDVKLRSVDAGIVWDATTEQYDDLAKIEVPELDAGTASIGISVLRSTSRPTEALRFARYLGASDQGLRDFAEFGFDVVDGDRWDEHPELTVFAGSVNRKAIESIIADFGRREGVRVNTVYDGCGILTSTMRTLRRDQQSGFPDAYMACDVHYLETVSDWFQDAVHVSDTSIVMVVQPGNPKGITELSDLSQPGVRVALGQPEQCTIGVLSRRLLEDAGIYKDVIEENVVTQSANSALLIPNITTKAADVVLAYESDTLKERDKLEIVPIDSPLAKAIQPYSISRTSEFKHLGRRLYARIADSQATFEAAGFNWRLATVPPSNVAPDSQPSAAQASGAP